MRVVFALLLALHGLIHLLGFAKAFGFADLPALRQPIGRAAGGAWLLAAVLFLTAAALLAVKGPWGWAAAPATLLSQGLLLQAWSDARHGTWPNLITLAFLILAGLGRAPVGLPGPL